MPPDIASLKERIVNDLGPDGVSVYTGPLNRPHVQVTVPKTPPERGSLTARFYSHAQYTAFRQVQERKDHATAA